MNVWTRIWLRSCASLAKTVYMSDVAPRAADPEVMNRAERENRLVLTEDKDFGDLVFRQARRCPASSFCGSTRHDVRGLLAAIDWFGDTLFGRYTVIEDARFRSRPLRSP